MNIKCLFGHKYNLREVHACEKPDKPEFNAAIMMKCERCGKTKLEEKMKTIIVISERYLNQLKG